MTAHRLERGQTSTILAAILQCAKVHASDIVMTCIVCSEDYTLVHTTYVINGKLHKCL